VSRAWKTASISGSVTFPGGKSHHDFEPRKENGAWKVCGEPY
jgi:hypothetical protein